MSFDLKEIDKMYRGTRLATAWEAELIFDLYILILTLYKSYTDIHKPRDKLKSPSILTTMLLRDGAVYCGCLFLWPGYASFK